MCRLRFRLWGCLLALAGLACSPAAGAEAPAFEPGREVRLETDGGFRGHLRIYVPSNYTPDRRWPVVFCYHGYNGNPTTGPIRPMLDGEDYIVVGMDYQSEAFHDNPATTDPGGEIENMRKVLRILTRHLNIESRCLFMGGFSQGGYATSVLGEELLGDLRGLIILGAGRSLRDAQPPPPNRIRGVPIFIGAGEDDDPHGRRAEFAADTYRQWGADVTAEFWPGVGHSAKRDTPTLHAWLTEHGPLAHAARDLAAVSRLERRDPVAAHEAYLSIAALDENHPVTKRAADAAKAIEQAAQDALTQADEAVEDDRPADAIRPLLQVRNQYAGLDAAAQAQQRLIELANGDALDETHVRQIVASLARLVRREAQQAVQEDEPARAIALYEEFIDAFPEARERRSIQAQLDRLRDDPATAIQLRDAEVADECERLLAWAETYYDLGQRQQTRELLEHVAERYPDTSYAQQAERLLGQHADR